MKTAAKRIVDSSFKEVFEDPVTKKDRPAGEVQKDISGLIHKAKWSIWSVLTAGGEKVSAQLLKIILLMCENR